VLPSVYRDLSDGHVLAECLMQNVLFEMTGASPDDTRAALSQAADRVSAAVTP
jgi:hypothetical protein